MDHYQIVALATQLVNELHKADEKTLDWVYQRLANRANDSLYGSGEEPFSGLCVTIQAEWSRRANDAGNCVEASHACGADPKGYCFDCGEQVE